MRILLWAVVIALTFYSNNTFAQTCSTIPDCSSLGYTQAASDCINNNYTACPFDATKVKCQQTKSCAAFSALAFSSAAAASSAAFLAFSASISATVSLYADTASSFV